MKKYIDRFDDWFIFFGIRRIAACCRCRCSSGRDDVGICRRIDIQYAHTGRNSEDGRPYCKGNDVFVTLGAKGAGICFSLNLHSLPYVKKDRTELV